MSDLTPKEIVAELDRHIVGQHAAKRAVAIALRNRWRRQRLEEDLRKEVTPKNIIMIGPTGVGKTEIARRLAKIAQAPFVKVEATKYTEVGYVGRDVESIVRELTEAALRLVRAQERERIEPLAAQRVRERLLDLLLPSTARDEPILVDDEEAVDAARERVERSKSARTRERMGAMLDAGELEERIVSVRVERKRAPFQVFNMEPEQMDVDFQGLIDRLSPKPAKPREMTIREARKLLLESETEELLQNESLEEQAVQLAEESGIIFLDEIDKVCGPSSSSGPDVSRQGVQRDLLPIVEGTAVQTRYGVVRTDHVLFIAAGAFHLSKPSDLMPELQGRFPIRVELTDLGRDDFVRILQEPANSLLRQYKELLATEGLTIEFTEDAITSLAELAVQVNRQAENIGARRLHTMLERTLEDPSFDAPDLGASKATLTVDGAFVRSKLEPILKTEDLSKYVL